MYPLLANESSRSINGFSMPSRDDKAPKPKPTEKSKSPIFFDATIYSPENLPVPIKSLKPILNSGNLSVS